jgi:hypothetical protein
LLTDSIAVYILSAGVAKRSIRRRKALIEVTKR